MITAIDARSVIVSILSASASTSASTPRIGRARCLEATMLWSCKIRCALMASGSTATTLTMMPHKQPTVSVCMAAFNGGKYIEIQLRSILSQLGTADQVVIVDDCSQDDTVARIR